MKMTERSFITREMLRLEPDTLFVFGDNMRERGYGGQAKEMRGEPNAVGIPTKWDPSNREEAFFIDFDLPAVEGLITQRFNVLLEHLSRGGTVVWPSNGIGTGLAQLEKRAPKIWALIESGRLALQSKGK